MTDKDFQLCMKKMEAFQQLLINDEPHPAWTNFLTADEVRVISRTWREHSIEYKSLYRYNLQKKINSKIIILDACFTSIIVFYKKE